MKSNKLIKTLTIMNFFILMIGFIACQTGAIKKNKEQVEITKEKTEIDEAYVEISEMFTNSLTVKISSSKMAPILKKEDISSYNKIFAQLFNFKFFFEEDETPRFFQSANDKTLILSTKSGPIVQPKQIQKNDESKE